MPDVKATVPKCHTQQLVNWLKLDEVTKRELSKSIDTSRHISAQLQVFGQNFQLVKHTNTRQ